jgi:hypothetical protein
MKFWISFKTELQQDLVYWISNFLFLVGWLIVYFCMQHRNVWLQSPIALLPVLFFMFIVMVISSLKYRFPLFAQELKIIDAMLKLYAVFFVCYSLSPVLLTTSYYNISHALLQFDRSLGFDQSQLMLWLFHQPVILGLLHLIYSAMLIISLLLFGVVGYFDYRAVFRGLIMTQWALLLASITFFFLPSTSPVFFSKEIILSKNFPRILNNFFMQSAHDVKQIALVHQGEPPIIQHSFHAGFIAFPSIHCFIALLVVFLSRKVLGGFFYLFLIYAVCILMAVLGLGEHYLLDLVGAVVLFFVNYYCSGKLIAWQNKA